MSKRKEYEQLSLVFDEVERERGDEAAPGRSPAKTARDALSGAIVPRDRSRRVAEGFPGV